MFHIIEEQLKASTNKIFINENNREETQTVVTNEFHDRSETQNLDKPLLLDSEIKKEDLDSPLFPLDSEENVLQKKISDPDILYTDHIVKEELVIGPELLQHPSTPSTMLGSADITTDSSYKSKSTILDIEEQQLQRRHIGLATDVDVNCPPKQPKLENNLQNSLNSEEPQSSILIEVQIMEEVKKPSYKCCMVPMCKNTTISTPDKVFFSIPRGPKVRKQWCTMMRKDNVSPLSALYCCEDHFNVKEDTVNYIEYNIMKEKGEKRYLRLKKGVVPHKFFCQKRNVPPPVKRGAAAKRQRLTLVNEALSEYADKSNILKIGRTSTKKK